MAAGARLHAGIRTGHERITPIGALASRPQMRLNARWKGYSHQMANFRIVDPHGQTVAAKNFDSAEAAHAWFSRASAGSTELGWRMEVDDDGQWAFFDDTEGFTAPVSHHPVPSPRRR